MKIKMFLGMAFILTMFAVSMKAQVPPVEPTDTDFNGIRNVSTLNHLVWMNSNYNYCYRDSFELDNDINASSTANWNGGYGFESIGRFWLTDFEGTFYGKNHSIDSLYINSPYGTNWGFIASSKGLIKDLSIKNCHIVGYYNVGALVGLNNGRIENCSSSGYVEGDSQQVGNYSYNVGGLVGYSTGEITSSNSSADVVGSENVGGLIGNNNVYDMSPKLVSKCFSTGTIKGKNFVGGLIGLNRGLWGGGVIIGGEAAVIKCYSISNVYGNNYVGGFVGGAIDRSNIENSYAMGRVISSTPCLGIGGFIGYANNNSYVTNCYSQGAVVGTGLTVGGFNGITDDPLKVTYCHWDNVISGQTTSASGISTSQSNMYLPATFTNWDLTNIWDINTSTNGNYPYLRDVAPINNVLEPVDTDADGFRNIIDLRYLRWLSEYDLGWSWNYELDNDLIALTTNEWNCGLGFGPIGNYTIKFTGQFNGNNHILERIFINRPTEDYVGLFGYTDKGAAIRNIRLTNCYIKGYSYVGGISGYVGNYSNGGLALVAIENCITTGAINGYEYVGGLIGKIFLNGSPVSGTYVTKSCSKCNVYGNSNVGGLIGWNTGWISNCYSRGQVNGYISTGGAFGTNTLSGLIEKCYSTGVVNANIIQSGLIARNDNPAQVIDSYWDIATSTKQYSVAGTGKFTFDMINPNTFVGWDFSNTWECIANENDNYPSFRGVPIYKRNIDSYGIGISNQGIFTNVYPNPISIEAKLTIDSDNKTFANIHIYNTLGQLVKSCFSGEIDKGKKEISLNLQDLNEGSYYIIIENNSVLSCNKIIISR